MAKRALLVGIDHYDNFRNLAGCINDVRAVLPLLARNEDNSPNFSCESLTSDGRVDRRDLLAGVAELLAPGVDVALLYFSGHGAASNNDVVLAVQDGAGGDEGIALSAILGQVQHSPVPEVVIILDCCFSGGAGGVPQLGDNVAALRHGVSLLSASRADQPAAEQAGRGKFSVSLCGALEGGAADVLGSVTVAGVYAYLSESFGPWDQRPTFKANVDRLHDLRRCTPAVPIEQLRRLPELFPNPDEPLPLDPSYEPDAEPEHAEHQAIFGILQKCRSAKLVEPVGADHLYFAAMQSKACQLTPLGKLYHLMAREGRL
jgi:hypothetical protein